MFTFCQHFSSVSIHGNFTNDFWQCTCTCLPRIFFLSPSSSYFWCWVIIGDFIPSSYTRWWREFHHTLLLKIRTKITISVINYWMQLFFLNICRIIDNFSDSLIMTEILMTFSISVCTDISSRRLDHFLERNLKS